MKAQKIQKNHHNSPFFYEDVPFDTETLSYYFTSYGSKFIQMSAQFMMPLLFQVIQYHADDNLKVYNSNSYHNSV